MKILGTLACVGVLGMGVIGNSVMAAESTGNTNVFYASNSTQMLLWLKISCRGRNMFFT